MNKVINKQNNMMMYIQQILKHLYKIVKVKIFLIKNLCFVINQKMTFQIKVVLSIFNNFYQK